MAVIAIVCLSVVWRGVAKCSVGDESKGHASLDDNSGNNKSDNEKCNFVNDDNKLMIGERVDLNPDR